MTRAGSAPSCDDDFSCPDLGECHANLAALKCHTINASIRVEGDVDSLAGLETIREITGALIIDSAPLQDVSGLSGLESVGGYLYLLNLPVLKSAHLPSLSSAPSIIIQRNPQLPRCEVAALVTRVGASCVECTDNNDEATCN